MGIINDGVSHYEEVGHRWNNGENMVLCRFTADEDGYGYKNDKYKGKEFKTDCLKGRSELLIIRNGDEVFLSKRKGEIASKLYSVPGGTWEKGRTRKETAIKESKEEAYKIVKRDTVKEFTEYVKPIKKKKKSYQKWDGYYTLVFVGEYRGRFKGFVSLKDRDYKIKKGKFYKIDDVFDMLHPAHQDAIKEYLKIQNNISQQKHLY